MKILITTPLYPPDIAPPAPYIKELAGRLAKEHTVTILTYGHLPEKIQGVSFVCIDKRRPLALRLLRFSTTLFKKAARADIIFSENGASVELPVGLAALLTRTPLVLHFGDSAALNKAKKSRLLRTIHRFALRQATATVGKSPEPKPEILPFDPIPQEKLTSYENSWKVHMDKLNDIFKKCRK